MRERIITLRTAVMVSGGAIALSALGVATVVAETRHTRALPVPTTLDDFFLPGTQPDPTGNVLDPIVGVQEGHCVNCHAGFNAQYLAAEPFRNWSGSMMAQALRDPLFKAALTVANQDAAFSGDLCLRCHTRADVRLYYQSMSKDYADFLLAENSTDSTGTTIYNQWDTLGRSAPIDMDFQTLAITPIEGPDADLDGDGNVDGADLAVLLASWTPMM